MSFYRGSLYLGHCLAENFVEDIHEFKKSVKPRSFNVVTFGCGCMHCEQIFLK